MEYRALVNLFLNESHYYDDYDDLESEEEVDKVDPEIISSAHNKGFKIGPVYHGTNAPKFSKFKTGIKTTRGILFTTFEFENSGFFFAPTEKEALNYGKRVVSCFLKLENPLPTYDSLRINKNRESIDRISDLNYIFDPIIERGDYADCVDLFINKPCVKYYDKKDGMNILQLIGSHGEYDWSVFDNVEVCKRMKEKKFGYAKCTESEGVSGYSYFVTDPKNIKLADSVTYDDNNIAIPISERFNSSTDDIRY